MFVTLKLVRFIETWILPVFSSLRARAFTFGSCLISFAIVFARSKSVVSKFMLYAIKKSLTPMTVAPAVGCLSFGPKSGGSLKLGFLMLARFWVILRVDDFS